MSSFVNKLPRFSARGASSARKPLRIPSVGLMLAILGGICLTMLLGAVVALGALQLTVLLTGMLVFVPLVLFVNTRMLLPILFVLVFLVQGTVSYFFNLRLAVWMASGVCFLFFLRAVLELVTGNQVRKSSASRVSGGGGVLLAGCLFLAFYFFSLSMGNARPIQIISTLRFTLPMWGVLFALYWFDWSERRMVQLWNLMVIVMLVQLPVVAYQHQVMISSIGWDGVVGTFGAGMSPILVMFTLATMMYLLARWTRGLTPVYVVVGCGIFAFGIILMGEVKAIMFWMPVGVMWVVRRRMLRNLSAFIIFCCIGIAFTAGTYTAYKAMYWGADHGRDDTVVEALDSMGGYVVDPNNINYRTGEISRGAGLMLWYSDTLPTTIERLIGFGPSASMIGATTGRGVVAERYRPLAINSTSLAVLLWDVGIIGAAAYVLFLASGVVTGVRFVWRERASPVVMAMMDTSIGVVALLMTTLVYDHKLIDEPALQLLLFFCLGTIVQCIRFRKENAPAQLVTDPTPQPGILRHPVSVIA